MVSPKGYLNAQVLWIACKQDYLSVLSLELACHGDHTFRELY